MKSIRLIGTAVASVLLHAQAFAAIGADVSCNSVVRNLTNGEQTWVSDCGSKNTENLSTSSGGTISVSAISPFSESYDDGSFIVINTDAGAQARAGYGNIGIGTSAKINYIKTNGYRIQINSFSQSTYFDTITVTSNALEVGSAAKIRIVSEVFYGIEQNSLHIATTSLNETSIFTSTLSVTGSNAKFNDFFCGGIPEYCGKFSMNGYFRHLNVADIDVTVGENIYIYASLVASLGLDSFAIPAANQIYVEGGAQVGIGAMNSHHLSIIPLTEGLSYTSESGTFYNFASSVPEPSSFALLLAGIITSATTTRKRQKILQNASRLLESRGGNFLN